ncbi:hypothetical protein KJ599_00380 [bacterium]|nr:hypothetical protein [bacterium]
MKKSAIIKLLLCLILISFLSVDYASGENKGNSITWDKTFGGSSEDMGFSIIQTENGGYAVAGYTILDREERKDTWRAKLGYIELTEDKRQDFWIIKIDKNGNIEWDEVFGENGPDIANSIIRTKDGGYAVAGFIWTIYAGRQDIWIIKLDENGNKEWDKTFDKDENDVAYSIIQTEDGGYAIAASTGFKLWGEANCWVIKLDAKGNIEWENSFGGTGWDEIYSIIQTKDGSFVTTGCVWSKGAGRGDVYVAKLNKRGDLVWDKTFGGSENDEAHSIIQTEDKGYAVAGFTVLEDTGDRDIWVIKLDKDGNKVWDKTLGGASEDWANSIIQTKDGGYMVAGWTSSMGAGKTDVWIVKLDKRGDLIWDKTFGGSENDEAHSIIQTEDGGHAIAGWTKSKGAGNSDVWVLKLDENGNL